MIQGMGGFGTQQRAPQPPLQRPLRQVAGADALEPLLPTLSLTCSVALGSFSCVWQRGHKLLTVVESVGSWVRSPRVIC